MINTLSQPTAICSEDHLCDFRTKKVLDDAQMLLMYLAL